MQAYCVKCRTKREMKDHKSIILNVKIRYSRIGAMRNIEIVTIIKKIKRR